MNHNKLTLLIDGNWLLQSRMSVLANGFRMDNTQSQKDHAANELKDLLARSINVMLNRFRDIDNIILMADGGSWRKQLPVPEFLKDTTYKGNRTKDTETDWNLIYQTFNKFIKYCESINVTVSQQFNIEGDDWAWYWSRKLNSYGTNCIIWSSDCDLKQLVQQDKDTYAWTAWYNSKSGICLPKSLNVDYNDISFFFSPQYQDMVLEKLINISKHEYINPDEIVLSKIFCGDDGDNIKSVLRYQKNGRTYRFALKDYIKMVEDLNICDITAFLDSKDRIARYICDLPKYSKYNAKYEEVREMLDYNTKLVWLNNYVMPESLIISMNQTEYKLFDLSYIRNNYKVLIEPDEQVNEIMNIFEGL